MRLVKLGILTLTLLLAGGWLAGRLVTAQGGLTPCPEIVSQALASVESLCAAQPRNSACYGNALVNALFLDDTPAAFFENEGDIINLGLVRALQTSPYGVPEADAWGMSILSLQAGLPGALPGQNAIFLLMGGAEIESAVMPDSALPPARPVPAGVPFAARLRALPDRAAGVVVQIEPGQLLLADAQSADGRWFRVTMGDTYGWVERDALLPDPAFAALPVIRAGAAYTPMQAFYLRTGIGSPQCAVAPSALVVQGPQSFTVAINANGANISFDGTLVLETASADAAKVQGPARPSGVDVSGLLRVTVLQGQAVVEDATGHLMTIRAGESSTICLAEPDDLGEDGQPNDQPSTDACGGWTAPEPVSQMFRDTFALLDGFALNQPLNLDAPTPTNTPRPTFAPVAQQTRRPTVVPSVPTATPQQAGVPPTSAPPNNPPPAPGNTPAPTNIPTDTPFPTDTPMPTDPPPSGADVGISQVNVAPILISVGEEVCFHVKVRNDGPDVALGVSVSDLLPPGLSYSSSNVADGSYDSGADFWSIGDLVVGPEAQIWVCGTADAGTEGMTLSTTAFLSAGNDSSFGNNGGYLSVNLNP